MLSKQKDLRQDFLNLIEREDPFLKGIEVERFRVLAEKHTLLETLEVFLKQLDEKSVHAPPEYWKSLFKIGELLTGEKGWPPEQFFKK